jgi:hypothetical protein
MDNQKFYDFVRKIAADDMVLAESIITGYQSIYEPEVLTESFRDVAQRFKQGAKGAAMAAAIAAGGAHAQPPSDIKTPPSQVQVAHDPQDVMSTANKYLTQIKDDILNSDHYDVMRLDSFKSANAYYNKLMKEDQNAANLFARVLNATLKKQLGIAPPIGKQAS